MGRGRGGGAPSGSHYRLQRRLRPHLGPSPHKIARIFKCQTHFCAKMPRNVATPLTPVYGSPPQFEMYQCKNTIPHKIAGTFKCQTNFCAKIQRKVATLSIPVLGSPANGNFRYIKVKTRFNTLSA